MPAVYLTIIVEVVVMQFSYTRFF